MNDPHAPADGLRFDLIATRQRLQELLRRLKQEEQVFAEITDRCRRLLKDIRLRWDQPVPDRVPGPRAP
jgi:hypothetical protein